MIRVKKLEPVLFYLMLAICLIPVISVRWFVTADGPCHLYNARILLDWAKDRNVAFYEPFYFLNAQFDPNWLFYLIAFPAMWLLGPEWAEKTFLILYIVLFAFGLRFLVKAVSPGSAFISTIGLLFVYHKLLMTGFFNNSISIAMWFWTAGWWWKYKGMMSSQAMIVQAILFIILYFAHPIGLLFCLAMVGLSIPGWRLFDDRELTVVQRNNLMESRFKNLIVSTLPVTMLFGQYFFRSNWSADPVVYPLSTTLSNLWKLSSLVSMHSHEELPARLTSIFIISVFLLGILFRGRALKWNGADAMLLFLLFVAIIIFFPPMSITGGLEVTYRIAIIPFIAILLWCTSVSYPQGMKITFVLIALLLQSWFLLTRMPVHHQASDYAREIDTVSPHIQDTSTLLVLNYEWAGQNRDGDPIADRNWMFAHVDCYLGTSKSLVISDNYESHFPYFPVIARWNTDMYQQTDKDGINFDHRPPRADILSYKRRTQQEIDYVLMIAYEEKWSVHPYTREIFNQLDQAYDKVFVSENNRAVLYKRKA